MSKRAELAVFAAINGLVLSLAFGAGYAVRALSEGAPTSAAALFGTAASERYPLLAEVRRLVEAHYIGPLPEEQALEYGAIRGFVAALEDPYTVFVEPQAHELESNSLQGEFGGVGVTVSQNEAGEIVLSPLPDSPAAAAGILEGDVLVAVDATVIAPGMTVDQVTALVRGPIGSSVQLTVRHPAGNQANVTVVRQRIEIPSVTWQLFDADATIGLILISRFSDKTPAEVERAIDALHASGAQRYVLDLRNNGGGILESAVGGAGD